MSETEKHIGKLIRVGFATDILIKKVLADNNIEMETWHEDEVECFKDELYESHVISDGVIYTVERIPIKEYEDIQYAKRDVDGNIDFVVEFYNGGCSFSEAIEEAIDGMKERDIA